jgi:hypothetical protein
MCFQWFGKLPNALSGDHTPSLRPCVRAEKRKSTTRPCNTAMPCQRYRLANYDFDVTPALDRQYFHAIYFRGPCGVNFAIATDGPGFAIDVPNQGSGEMLSLPPWAGAQAHHD